MVQHKKHYLRIKRIMSVGLQIHQSVIEEYKFFPYKELAYVEIPYNHKTYMIPIKHIALYSEHPHPNEIMSLLQDVIKIVK